MYSKNKLWKAWCAHPNAHQKEKARNYVGYMLGSTYWKDIVFWQKCLMKTLGYKESEWTQFR